MPIEVVQLIVGWPAIVLFVAMATLGAWRSSQRIVLAGLILSLGPSFYLLGGGYWIPLAGLYIPLSLSFSIMLIRNKNYLLPKVLLAPIYCFYAWLGYVVVTQ
ncbi:MAG: hypothetical protein RL839_04790 [Gammaproteobacteria bacterium]